MTEATIKKLEKLIGDDEKFKSIGEKIQMCVNSLPKFVRFEDALKQVKESYDARNRL